MFFRHKISRVADSLIHAASVRTLFSKNKVFLNGNTDEIIKGANQPDRRRKDVKVGCREFAQSVYYK